MDGETEHAVRQADLDGHRPGCREEQIGAISGKAIHSGIAGDHHAAIRRRLRRLIRAHRDMLGGSVDEVAVHVAQLRAGGERDLRQLARIARIERGGIRQRMEVA